MKQGTSDGNLAKLLPRAVQFMVEDWNLLFCPMTLTNHYPLNISETSAAACLSFSRRMKHERIRY